MPHTPLTRDGIAHATMQLGTSCPILAPMVRSNGVPPLWARPPGFATLVRIILEQQVSLASAAAAYDRLSRGLGRVTPRRVLARPETELTPLGLTRQKARYCHALAEAILDGRLELAALDGAPPEQVHDALTAITGIGRWTADVYLVNALRHPDVWPRGDLALHRMLRRIVTTGVTAERLDDEAERWRPWRAVAARVLWHQYLTERRRR